jgi:hypothetical protein
MRRSDIARLGRHLHLGKVHVTRYSNRCHSAEFKLQVCTDIRSGKVSRLASQKLCVLSENLIQHWLTQRVPHEA